jgi:hypothetical protein
MMFIRLRQKPCTLWEQRGDPASGVRGALLFFPSSSLTAEIGENFKKISFFLGNFW